MPGDPGPVTVDLAGASAVLDSRYAPFRRYAALHLAPLRREIGAPAVRATLRWHEGQPPAERATDGELARLERIDRDLYRGEGRLAWFRVDELPGLHLRFAWDGSCLQVEGDYHYRLAGTPARDRVKRLLYRRRVEALRQRRFTTLLYYLLYYPCFWWLERRAGFHPIHAAGVDLGREMVVFAGPSGVGKSTLCAGLAARPGARVLSDTFLLHRGSDVRPVREPLLLDRWSREWIGAGADLLAPIAWRYCLGRDGFHWPPDRLSPGGTASAVFLPHRSSRHFVERVSPERAHATISAADFIVNDLRRYWAFAAVLEMLDPSPLMFAREQNLAALARDVPCYELGLTPDLDCERTAAAISELLSARRAGTRAAGARRDR